MRKAFHTGCNWSALAILKAPEAKTTLMPCCTIAFHAQFCVVNVLQFNKSSLYVMNLLLFFQSFCCTHVDCMWLQLHFRQAAPDHVTFEILHICKKHIFAHKTETDRNKKIFDMSLSYCYFKTLMKFLQSQQNLSESLRDWWFDEVIIFLTVC